MASFNQTSSKNKALAVARLISRTSGHTISWVNLTSSFSRAVFKAEPHEVTAKQMLEKLPALLNNQYVEVAVTDYTAELEAIDPMEY